MQLENTISQCCATSSNWSRFSQVWQLSASDKKDTLYHIMSLSSEAREEYSFAKTRKVAVTLQHEKQKCFSLASFLDTAKLFDTQFKKKIKKSEVHTAWKN